ncbi:MAG: cbb3-type cytochrome oxidase assembly protein CcoS [Mesorhizobium sp.]|nr:cbb3-type cytochrome oxidase assembly protein CcoS [Mesorhizobium sp.]MCO5163986.1 cbb3-type cytochrome oxidase assembly protein CcoS [Mesorhizobium sp.]
MTGLLAWLVPLALGMGLVGLLAFLWSMKSGQLDDLDGAAERVLHQANDAPLPATERHRKTEVEEIRKRKWE